MKFNFLRSSLVAAVCLFADNRSPAAPRATWDYPYGEGEVRQVVADRPQLQLIVLPGNPLWQWLVRGFAVSTAGTRVTWDPRPTSAVNPYGAESLYPQDSRTILVRVDGVEKNGERQGQVRPPEDVLIGLVFELSNVPNRDAAVGINNLAEIGHITRQKYVYGLARLEYSTGGAVENFYRTIWLPYCQAQHIAYRPELWTFSQGASFDDWLASIPPQSGYPWLAYGAAYDQMLNTRAQPRR